MDPIAIIIIVIVASAFLFAIVRMLRVKIKGVEAEGYISRIEETDSTDSDGDPTTTYDYYVVYKTEEGRQTEATVGNPIGRYQVGDRVRVKYMPGEESYALVIGKI